MNLILGLRETFNINKNFSFFKISTLSILDIFLIND